VEALIARRAADGQVERLALLPRDGEPDEVGPQRVEVGRLQIESKAFLFLELFKELVELLRGVDEFVRDLPGGVTLALGDERGVGAEREIVLGDRRRGLSTLCVGEKFLGGSAAMPTALRGHRGASVPTQSRGHGTRVGRFGSRLYPSFFHLAAGAGGESAEAELFK